MLQSRRPPDDVSLLFDDSTSAFELALKLHDEVTRLAKVTGEHVAIRGSAIVMLSR